MDGASFPPLFQLLATHQVDEAVEYAESHGWYRLAMILSQAGSDASLSQLVQLQLEQWKVTGALPTFPDELLRVYTVLASECTLSPTDSPLFKGIGWVRTLGMILWYYVGRNNALFNVSDALSFYEALWADGLADAPMPPQSAAAGVNHGLYSLLVALLAVPAERETKILAALDSFGYTSDELDCRATYILLVMFESLDWIRTDSVQSSLIRLQFIFQLLSEGNRKWALLVALQFPDVHSRAVLVDSVLSRWVAVGRETCGIGGRGSYGGDGSNNREAMEEFVLALGIPRESIHRALSSWCGYAGLYEKQIMHLTDSGQFVDAMQTICRSLAPTLMMTEDGRAQLLSMLDSLDDGCAAKLDTLSNVVLRYLRYKDAASASSSIVEDMRSVQEIKEETVLLLQQLEKLHNEDGLLKEPQILRIMLTNMSSYLFSVISDMESKLPSPSITLVKLDEFSKVPLCSNVVRAAVADSTRSFLECTANRVR